MMEEEKSQDNARLLSPDEIDGLDSDSHRLSQLDDRNSVDYQGSRAYGRGGSKGSGIMARLSPKTIKNALLGVGIAMLLILAASLLPGKKQSPQRPTVVNNINNVVPSDMMDHVFQKPLGVKITGVIFYGRARFVDLLDCYLQKNLASNGGLLDEVLFMENTDNEQDIKYLHDLVEKVPEYTRVPVRRFGGHGWGGFNIMWQSLKDDDTIYVKIDDDIVWMHDDAVARLVETLMRHPEAYDVAGNIINSPLTNWMHYHNDAVHPFLPELHEPAEKAPLVDWRPSTLPQYRDEIADRYNFEPTRQKTEPFKVGQEGGPPFEGHRWLPLGNTSEMLLHTPIEQAEFNAFGIGWTSWAIGAQQHYSLLQNIEQGLLSRYWFGNAEGVWNMQYGRYNLNFLAIWGKDVALEAPGTDDEQDLTVTFPFKYKRPCIVDTHALVAHFNFGTQPEIGHSDLLDRYRMYANEFVCAANNQKTPLP